MFALIFLEYQHLFVMCDYHEIIWELMDCFCKVILGQSQLSAYNEISASVQESNIWFIMIYAKTDNF